MDLAWLRSIPPSRIIGAVLVIALVLIVRRLLRKAPASAHTELKRCNVCGWTGQLSRYKPICPSCGKPVVS